MSHACGAASPARRPSSSGAAIAFATDIIAHCGEPVPGVDEDLVRVRLTQHELARRNHCSPSTISWYLRRLGPVVVDRHDGLVFDRRALARVRAGVPALAPRTAFVEHELSASFARPTADGSEVELLAGNPAAPRPLSLQDLATHLGINRSSAHRHLSALEHAGRLQRRGRRLYVVPPSEATKEPTMDQPPTQLAIGRGPVTPQQVLELLDKVADLLGQVADMATRLLVTLPGPGGEGTSEPRTIGAPIADDEALRAAEVADRARGFPSEVDLIDRNDAQITSNQEPPRAADSRDTSAVRAGDRGSTNPAGQPTSSPSSSRPSWPNANVSSCQESPTANAWPGASRPTSAEQVASAARLMATDLRGGAPMRSPIAILLRKAEDGDPYYFRATKAPPEASPPPPVLAEPQEVVDAEAQAAVDQLDAEALAELDKAVAAHVRSLLGEDTLAVKSPSTIAFWRPILWRQSQATPKTGE